MHKKFLYIIHRRTERRKYETRTASEQRNKRCNKASKLIIAKVEEKINRNGKHRLVKRI